MSKEGERERERAIKRSHDTGTNYLLRLRRRFTWPSAGVGGGGREMEKGLKDILGVQVALFFLAGNGLVASAHNMLESIRIDLVCCPELPSPL